MSEKPPAPFPAQYFLKTRPHTPAVTPLYLRLHGDGISAAVCTPSSPIYLRWEHVPALSYSEEGKEIATSWKHPGRAFGLVLSPPRVKYGWEEVLIVENGGDSGFVWEKGEDGLEVLRYKGVVEGEKLENVKGQEDGVSVEWKGWVVCEWMLGYPQLFWVTGLMAKKNEPPAYCEKVDIVREWLIPRDNP